MRSKIQNSMVLLTTVTLLIAYTILSMISYEQNMNILKSEVRQETKYIAEAVNASGSRYLEEMDSVEADTRLTYIDSNGDVLYDSRHEEQALGNHRSRKEVASALANGTGETIRMSDTIGKKLYYYAVRLDDGNVLRLSKEMNGLVKTALPMFPVILGLAIVMMILVYLMAKYQTARLIRPINNLNLEDPLANDVYEELTPLLTAMDKQNKEKEAMDNIRKEFSANVSHELKTPLTSISGYAEIMMNGMVRPDDIPVFSERIYKEASRLIHLIEDIIKISRLDEQAIELEKTNIDLYTLCYEIVGRLSTQAQHQQVHITLEGKPVMYCGVRQVIDEMIYNICENAIKYNKPHGKVKVWVGKTIDGAMVKVRDTGIGIPPEHIDRIFERFYRVDKSHSKETGGTGLGLSIVKHGAILHRAKVSVDSKVGEGTTIEIHFFEKNSEK